MQLAANKLHSTGINRSTNKNDERQGHDRNGDSKQRYTSATESSGKARYSQTGVSDKTKNKKQISKQTKNIIIKTKNKQTKRQTNSQRKHTQQSADNSDVARKAKDRALQKRDPHPQSEKYGACEFPSEQQELASVSLPLSAFVVFCEPVFRVQVPVASKSYNWCVIGAV